MLSGKKLIAYVNGKVVLNASSQSINVRSYNLELF